MSKIKKTSSADHADIFRRLLIISMLLLSLIFAVKAGVYFADDGMKSFLSIFSKILAVISLIMLAVTIFWKLKFIPRSERYHLLNTDDSFANQMMNKAFKISWLTTLLLLFFSATVVNSESLGLPAKFYLNLAVFLLLSTLSVSFLILFRLEDNGKKQEAGV